MTRALVLALLAACSGGGSTPDEPRTDAPVGSHDPDAPPGDGTIVAAACTGRQAQPLDATWTLTVGGASRKAKVHVPASYDPATGTPLVIGLHGLDSSADEQAARTHMIAKSDAAGFI